MNKHDDTGLCNHPSTQNPEEILVRPGLDWTGFDPWAHFHTISLNIFLGPNGPGPELQVSNNLSCQLSH